MTDEDFARYDRSDEQGNKISPQSAAAGRISETNKQRSTFSVAGTSGTGKTEFIAAFIALPDREAASTTSVAG